MPTILIPLPDHDFDVTEVAVPWRLLTDAGHQIVFATEAGAGAPAADPLLLTGVVFGKLGAEPEPSQFYDEMIASSAFNNPIAWASIDPTGYDGLLLAGGHAPGMKQFLGSELLQSKVAEFWALQRPVAAICHGVLVLARAKGADGRSILAESQTTCLPKYMERLAYWLTFWRRGRYYRTYPAYVQDEVRAALEDPSSQFHRGPFNLGKRGTAADDRATFLVKDGRYLSARWPGDAYALTVAFSTMLEGE